MNTTEIKSLKLNCLKLLFVGLSAVLFFTSIKSISFMLITSIMSGIGYYIIIESHPYTIVLLTIFFKCLWQRVTMVGDRFFQEWSATFFTKQTESVVDYEDGYGSLTYYDEGKKYIYLFPAKNKSNDLIVFKDENNNDITKEVEPYLGPLQNFHGVLLTPKDLNYKKIFVFRDGDICFSKTFGQNDHLIFHSSRDEVLKNEI
jgi:hypothetical protein